LTFKKVETSSQEVIGAWPNLFLKSCSCFGLNL
jgi:hypothetical protein